MIDAYFFLCGFKAVLLFDSFCFLDGGKSSASASSSKPSSSNWKLKQYRLLNVLFGILMRKKMNYQLPILLRCQTLRHLRQLDPHIRLVLVVHGYKRVRFLRLTWMWPDHMGILILAARRAIRQLSIQQLEFWRFHWLKVFPPVQIIFKWNVVIFNRIDKTEAICCVHY